MKRIKTILGVMAALTVLLAFCAVGRATPEIFRGAPKFKAWSTLGTPLAGGKLYSYEPNSSIPKTLYSNSMMTALHSNPVVLDENGEAAVWSAGPCKLVLRDSSGALLWTMDFVNGIGGTTGTDAVWPELYGAVGDGLEDDTAAFQAALTACPETGCRLLLTRTYRLTTDLTIPDRIELSFRNGGKIHIDAGSTLTITSPASIVARTDQHLFTGNGRPGFTKPGTVYVDWLGGNSAGTTDTSALITKAVSAAGAGGTVKFGAGTYLIDDQVALTVGVNLMGESVGATTLRAGSGLIGKSMLANMPSSNIDMQRIENLNLDGNRIADYGLEIKNGNIMTIRNVNANHFIEAAIYINGDESWHPRNYVYLYVINIEECNAGNSKHGFKIVKNGCTHVFNNFNFRNCIAYANTDAGLWLEGDHLSDTVNHGFYASFSGGSLDNNVGTAHYVVKNGVYLSLSNTYIEGPESGKTPKYFGYVSNQSRVDIIGGENYGHPGTAADGNSTVCSYGSRQNWEFQAGKRYSVSDYCTGDRISDKLSFGSPNYPDLRQSHGSGWYAAKGTVSIDSMGTKWMNTVTSTSSSTRWVPIDGRIMVPIDYTMLNTYAVANYLMFWAEQDFVVTAVDLVITETFASSYTSGCDMPGANGISVGTVGSRDRFISGLQGMESKLTAGSVIRAWDNNATDNVLGWNLSVNPADSRTITGKHKAFVMNGQAAQPYLLGPGGVNNAASDNTYIALFSCPCYGTAGNWVAGKGYLVITGYPLKYN